eukprot:TRINITY_DN8375_c0_g1_i1.p3 TRINITY_DN8375_c0_g1~~TRINITY_DN8375_c0_g1_i1.p3  ORF type:complete len:127 (-),score=0.81 TRINITY_DN8375_c0_g1_i1:134-514(-)
MEDAKIQLHKLFFGKNCKIQTRKIFLSYGVCVTMLELNHLFTNIIIYLTFKRYLKLENQNYMLIGTVYLFYYIYVQVLYIWLFVYFSFCLVFVFTFFWDYMYIFFLVAQTILFHKNHNVSFFFCWQ